MPTKIVDSDQLRFPSQKHIGIWQPDLMAHTRGTEGVSFLSENKTVSSAHFQKLGPIGRITPGRLEHPQAYFFKDHKDNNGPDHGLLERKSTIGTQMASWRDPNLTGGTESSIYAQPMSQLVEDNKVKSNGVHYESGIFSSSLSDVFSKKYAVSLTSNVAFSGRSVDTTNSNFGEKIPFESLEEIEAHAIGNLLPNDEDLLSGIIDHHDYIARPSCGDDIEDDLFSSVGGMELEVGNNSQNGSDFIGRTASHCQVGEIATPSVGEHLYGGRPSRNLLMRNISSNVKDAELRDLFKQYGDIHTLYTASKQNGFIMISYFDIRAAFDAMRALQNKPLGHGRVEIQFSVPKVNPSEKDSYQATLRVIILDLSVSNDDLRQIFGVYGEIKEIRDSQHKHHHKLIEFFDVRAREAAFHAINKNDIAGKKIKLESSQCLTQQRSPTPNQQQFNGFKRGSSSLNSPSDILVSCGTTTGAESSTALDNIAFEPLISPFLGTAYHGISSGGSSSTTRVATINSQINHSGGTDLSHTMEQMNLNYVFAPAYHPRSLPEFNGGIISGTPSNSPSALTAMDIINCRPAEGTDNRDLQRVGTGSLNSHFFEHHEGTFGVHGNGMCPLHGLQYVNPDTYHQPTGPMMWQNSLAFENRISHPPPGLHSFQRASTHAPNRALSLHNHHFGSAPTVNPSVWGMQHAYARDSLEPSAFHPGSLGHIGFAGSSPVYSAQHNIFSQAGGNCINPSTFSAHVAVPASQQRCHIFNGKNIMSSSYDAPHDRVRSRRSDTSASQADNKRQFELDLVRIMHAEDSRTTLMIKNIPNKYTSKMLLATIDEHHRGSYDFIYLPIDFKNKCNVGYAFINMIDPQHIIPLYKAFNGKKWEKFNSEKVASLAYARIQGRQALIAHFQNSSLMNEDKRCRPILFHTDGPNTGDQEPFPMGTNIRCRPGRARSAATEETHQGSPPSSSSSGSTKGSE